MVEAQGCTLLFSGTLAKDVHGAEGDLSSDEGRVLSGYLREGTALFPRLRGQFVVALVDRRNGVSYAFRDPTGGHPLFFATDGNVLYLSPHLETVARREGNRPELDRVLAAGFLLKLMLEGEETLLVGVRRLLQGHLIENYRGRRFAVRRYWVPQEDGSPYTVERLRGLLWQAVERLEDGRAGIFLSGGLDSALVAAIAADLARSRRLPPPLALSLVFRGTDADEEPMQRKVALRLGLEQLVSMPEELVPPGGLLQATLELARTAVSRPPDILTPSYAELGRVAGARGCTVILDGSGGDEFFLPPPGYPADRLVSFDALALAQLCRAWAAYWPGRQPFAAVRGVLWRSGIRAVARPLYLSLVGDLRPALPAQVRRNRAEKRIPPGIAADEEVRRHLLDRVLVRTTADHPRRTVKTQRQAILDADFLSIAREEAFELQTEPAPPCRSPLLDPDVIELLHLLPPRLLTTGGRAKAPARDVLAGYLHDLADSWPRTVYGDSFWEATIVREGRQAWSNSGGVPLLADMGLVDHDQIMATLNGGAERSPLSDLRAAWRALSLESWLGGINQRSDRL